MSFPQAGVAVVQRCHDSAHHPRAPDMLAAKDAEIAQLKDEINALKASATAPELAAAAHMEHNKPLPPDTPGNLSTPLALCAVSCMSSFQNL